MKLKNSIVSGIVLVLIVISVIVFYMLYKGSQYEVADIPVTQEGLEEWTLENSELNGAPLNEYKVIYQDQNKGEITKAFITVFPTEDKEENLLDFSVFDLQTARNKAFNPELNANVQFTTENEDLLQDINLNTVNATIRVRGNSSRGAEYKSYKVKLLDGAGTFYGQSVLNLNKHSNDISKISNKFCMDLMAKVNDVASFRTNFMLVYIRDASLPEEEQSFQYYGLYTQVEQPNKSYLKLRGFDETASLYKANNFEFRLAPELKDRKDPEYDEAAFETVLAIREGKDHSKLLQMLEDINDINRDFDKDFATYFNEDNYLTWMACNLLLGNEDTIAHNFLLYNSTNSMTWYMIPWDYDGTFRFGEYASMFSVPDTLKGIQRFTGVLLHRRYLKQNDNMDKLTKKMEELLATSFSPDRVNDLLNSYKPVLEKTMTIAPDLLISELPPNEISDYLDQFDEQIQLNYLEYKEALKYPIPVFVSEPERLQDGSIHFAWETSFDFQGDLLTYGITLAKDYEMKDIVFKEEGLVETIFDYKEEILAGTYYLAVTIKDSQGNEQISLDYYDNPAMKVYEFGVRQVTFE